MSCRLFGVDSILKQEISKTNEIMKVAIFIKNNELTVLHEENVHVIIFNLKDDKVIGVKNIVLEKQTNDSIVYWLILNSINQIYISEINDQTLQRVKSKGIEVKTLESLENDKLYNTLALSSFKLKKSQ